VNFENTYFTSFFSKQFSTEGRVLLGQISTTWVNVFQQVRG